MLEDVIGHAQVGRAIWKREVGALASNQMKFVQKGIIPGIGIDVDADDASAFALQDFQVAAQLHRVFTMLAAAAAYIDHHIIRTDQGVHTGMKDHRSIEIGVAAKSALRIEILLQTRPVVAALRGRFGWRVERERSRNIRLRRRQVAALGLNHLTVGAPQRPLQNGTPATTLQS